MNQKTTDEESLKAFEPQTDYEVPVSEDAPVSGWLKLTYLVLPVWGVFTLFYYINGSHGWLDRGYWEQLQIASNTTFPVENHLLVKPETSAELKEDEERFQIHN